MVGVAGKSRGCNTCRRRKVRCDEAKPTCERCKRSKRKCEGYERFPVFIQRTQNGYEKRAPLEEVKSCPSTVVLSFASANAEATRLISWFWESFARAAPSKYALQSPSHWLDHFMNGDSSLPPLREALLAVSVTRLSRTAHRPDILKEGRQMYIKCLGLARKAIVDPKLSLHDDILATSCVMTLYELFDATSDNLDGWLDHLSGIYRLLQYRGPKMHSTVAARSVFEHCRYLLMLKHLISRKTCILGQPEWLECPWEGVKKSVEQQVFDQGLKLTSVFDRYDRAVEASSDNVDLIQLFNDSAEIYETMKRLQVQSIEPAVGFDLDGDDSSDTAPLIVSNPAAVMLNITALGILLGGCVTACDVSHLISKDLVLAPTNTPGNITSPATQPCLDRRQIAKKIMRLVKICIDERVGVMGAARMIFSLRLAIRQFHATDPEMEECNALLEQLSGLGRRFKGFMGASISHQVARGNVELIEENAQALAAQWQQLADIIPDMSMYSCWKPSHVGYLPLEALRTWAR